MMINKGLLFWYRSRGKRYAALILDIINDGDYFFVLISEDINDADIVNKIMEVPAYTAAWFSSCEMISPFRIHFIGEGYSTDCFNGYAGGFFSEQTVIIHNCGQSKTWKHEYRQLSFHGRKMKELLCCSDYNLLSKVRM